MRARLPIAVAALVVALGAIGAVLYVVAEPVQAIERLREDPMGFSPAEQRELIEGRFGESGVPLLLGSAGGALALVLALVARRSTLGAAAILAACLALAGAAYVWARYGDGVWRHL